MSKTKSTDKIAILAELWINYRQDPDFEDFINYNDLGLPLAYLLDEKVVDLTEKALVFINETFDLLLAGLELTETGFTNLDEMLSEDNQDAN